MNNCSNHQKCTEEAIIAAEEICIKNQIRFTTLRKKIFKIITASHQPIKAYDIIDRLDEKNTKPTTIYRILDVFLEYGLIHRLNVSNSYISCSHPLEHNKCSFLICNKCAEVQECCDASITNQLKRISTENKFKIENAVIEIRGICSSCV